MITMEDAPDEEELEQELEEEEEFSEEEEEEEFEEDPLPFDEADDKEHKP